MVGLGEQAELDTDAIRKAGAAIADAASRTATVATTVHGSGDLDPAAAAQALVEGVALGAYRFTSFKSDPTPHELASVTLHVVDDVKASALKSAVADGEAIAAAVALVRDLVNTPPGDKRPPAFADRATEVAKGAGIKVKVLDEKDLEKGGYGGLLGVGAGSSAPPRLVELSYKPSGAKKHVALVGKGITFDSGGLSLKPPEAMETMKMDMGGAATVLGVMQAVAALEAQGRRCTGILALAENMPSRLGDASERRAHDPGRQDRRGDEHRRRGAARPRRRARARQGARPRRHRGHGHAHRCGVDRARRPHRHRDVDRRRALGRRSWPPASAPASASGRCRSRPTSTARSSTARSRTSRTSAAAPPARSPPGCSCTTSSGDDVPWAHLDIAGVAWSDTKTGYLTKGATGVPVRMLVDWLRED